MLMSKSPGGTVGGCDRHEMSSTEEFRAGGELAVRPTLIESDLYLLIYNYKLKKSLGKNHRKLTSGKSMATVEEGTFIALQ